MFTFFIYVIIRAPIVIQADFIYLLPPWQRRLCFGSVGLSVCLSVDNIT